MALSGKPHPSKPLFEERQRFTQPWLYLLLGGVVLATLCSLVVTGFSGNLATGSPPALMAIFIGVLVGLAIPVWVFLMRLEVTVRSDGLYYRFVGLHRKIHRIALADIVHFYPRSYRPIAEYGGWGIRWGSAGKAYNVKGNRGVQLMLRNGKRLLFGSQQSEAFVSALERASGRPRSQPRLPPA
jgi:hypothetical protein